MAGCGSATATVEPNDTTLAPLFASPTIAPTATLAPRPTVTPASRNSVAPSQNTVSRPVSSNPAHPQKAVQAAPNNPPAPAVAPAPTATPTPAPAAVAPTATPTQAPTAAPTPTQHPSTMPDGAPWNPWSYDFEQGSTIASPPAEFCNYFNCITNFGNGKGYVEECKDAMYSKSGGVSGSCSGHSGNNRILYSH